jgi:hypothetical protein
MVETHKQTEKWRDTKKNEREKERVCLREREREGMCV